MVCHVYGNEVADGRFIVKDVTGAIEVTFTKDMVKELPRRLTVGDVMALRNMRVFRMRRKSFLQLTRGNVGMLYYATGGTFQFAPLAPPGASKSTREAFSNPISRFTPIPESFFGLEGGVEREAPVERVTDEDASKDPEVAPDVMDGVDLGDLFGDF